MNTTRMPPVTHRLAAVRVLLGVASGIAGGFVVSLTPVARLALVAGWIAGALVYLAVTWLAIGPMSRERTASHATAEDQTKALSEGVLIVASLASLGGVAVLLLGSSTAGVERVVDAVTGVGSVVMAWLVVHTIFTLRYAALYYTGQDGGIDFNSDLPPDYADFAYLAFTIGMTYQVSDTSLTDAAIRRTALKQGLLAYLLGSVVLASTINLVVQLGSSGG